MGDETTRKWTALLSNYADGYETEYAWTHYLADEEGIGEVLIPNFSFFLTHTCTIRDFSEFTPDLLKRFVDAQATDFIRYIYLSTESSTSQAIYTGFPDGNFYQSGGEIDFFVNQQLACAATASQGGNDISAYDPRLRPWYI